MASIRAAILRQFMKKVFNFNKSLEETRKELENLSIKLKIPKSTNIISVSDNLVKGELIIPKSAPDDEIIYFLHAGGYCLGIYDSTRNHVLRVSKILNKRIFLLDYRVAPENPYPASVNDAYAGYNWILKNGYKPDNIYFYGESAGCGLALNTLIKLRDNNEDMPKCSIFSTPFLDATMSGSTVKLNSDKDPFYCDEKYYISNHYVADNAPDDPEISPIFAELNNLPPFLVHAAEYDMLLSDSISFKDKIDGCKGKAKLKVWEGMWHVFHMNADLVPESKRAIKEFGEYINSIK